MENYYRFCVPDIEIIPTIREFFKECVRGVLEKLIKKENPNYDSSDEEYELYLKTHGHEKCKKMLEDTKFQVYFYFNHRGKLRPYRGGIPFNKIRTFYHGTTTYEGKLTINFFAFKRVVIFCDILEKYDVEYQEEIGGFKVVKV